MNNVNIALKYEKRGFCVIPIKKDKRPFIPWAEYQERKAGPAEIREWFKKWPNANVGIVTGQVSGIVVIDIDEPQGFEEIEKYLPDSIAIPTCKTPKGGQHLYFKAPEKPIGNNSRLIPGCDFRGDGGYIIAPPSMGYEWLEDLSLDETEPPPLPADAELLFSSNSTSVFKGKVDNLVDINEKTLKFQLGTRDEDLFHVANCLLKSPMRLPVSTQVLKILAANCDPPFDPKEAENKIRSALARVERGKKNLSSEIREWVLSTSGRFSSTDIYRGLLLSTFPEQKRAEQKLVWKVLNQMTREGLVERIPELHGGYRTIDKECEDIDFLNADLDAVDLKLPFEIEKKVEIMPGNILTIAGEMNTGKTAFLLNVVKMNMESMNVHFFSSEMGESELKKRLMRFTSPPNIYNWNFKAHERSRDFSDVIVPGKGNLNIIDYLELHDEFYKVAGFLADIHRKLNGAVAFVALQKNPGKDVGRGGYMGLEKPRLYLTMGRDENGENKLKILKAKNWATEQNPNGLKIGFKLVNGCEFIRDGDWH